MKSGAPGLKGVPSSSACSASSVVAYPDAPDGPEHRRQDRERIDADVDEGPHRVEAGGSGCQRSIRSQFASA